jgi:hypothetical protein
VLWFDQKRVAGFSAGKTIHYHDLGPVRVAPGNAVLPLIAITNGVASQYNITEVPDRAGRHRLPAALGDRQRHMGRVRRQAPAHVVRGSEAGREERRARAREDDARCQLPHRSLRRILS